MDTQTYTIIIESENKPGVLNRISGIFVRRKINIESLTVYETETKGASRFTIAARVTLYIKDRLVQSIKKIIEVTKVEVITEEERYNKKASTVTATRELSSVVTSIEVSIIKRVELLARSKKNVVSLAQGIPSFFTPDYIKQAAKDAMDKGLTDKYTPGFGIEELRIALAKKVKKQNNIQTNPSDIIVTHGGIEALMAVFMTLLNPKDELIILTPDYASHITQAKIAMHGGNPVCVPLDETKNGWVLNPEKLEQAITPNSKAIVICNPCNPTGKVYTKEELKAVARIAVKHNLYIVTDEIYQDFVFDGKKHISIGSFKEVADRTISVFGLSKSYAMTGWRIGYIVTNQTLMSQIFKIHDSLVTCPTAVSQYAALAAIKGDKKDVAYFKEEFEKRRKIVIDELKKTKKVELTIPEGAYYAFVRFKKPIDDVAFCMELIEKAKVAVVPGSPFGKGGENHIRISFGCNEETLKKGLQRFVSYINKKL